MQDGIGGLKHSNVCVGWSALEQLRTQHSCSLYLFSNSGRAGNMNDR